MTGLWKTWLVLVTLTLGSFALTEELAWAHFATALAFAIAAFKGDLVMVHFMEVRAATAGWQSLYRGWLIVVTLALIAGHLLG